MSNVEDYVKMKHFIGTMAIASSLLLAMLTYTLSCVADVDRKIDVTRTEYIRIESRLAEIQTDLVWIKQSLK